MLVLLFLLLFAAPAGAATFYVSQGGSGTTCSSGTPCQVASVWAKVSAGDNIVAIAGTYTGTSSMITPPAGKKGTSSAPITFSCETDGACFFNGQDARRPMLLTGGNDNDWFIFEGFNAGNSNDTVIQISTGNDNNILRRVCAWNAAQGSDNSIILINGNAGNLIEDNCAFGKGRKQFTNISSSSSTFRRNFGIWNEHDTVGPKMVFSSVYSSYNATFENNIGMWNGLAPDQPYGILSMDSLTSAPWETNSKFIGSMGFIRSTFTANTNMVALSLGASRVDNYEFKDIVYYLDPGSHTTIQAFQLDSLTGGGISCATTADGICQRYLTNATKIGFTLADSINLTVNGWTVTNNQNYATIAAMNTATANPFQATAGTGARVCFRYQNGVLTSNKLWPWPMDSRINAALTAAGFSPTTYFGSGNTLTQYIESVFGAIPAACRTDSVSVATYTVLELGAETIPTAWNSPAFQNANVVNYQGSETGGTACGGSITHKILWDDTTTDRMYHSINCLDSQAVTLTTTEDDAGLTGSNEDKWDIRWKNNLTTTCDANTFRIIANLFPTFSDANCSGGTFSTTPDLNVTVVRNIVSGTSWNMFIAHDVGFATAPNVAINAQFAVVDRDTSNAIRWFNGASSTDLSAWGQITLSSTTVPASSAPTYQLDQVAAQWNKLHQTDGAFVALRPLDNGIRIIRGGKAIIETQLNNTLATTPALNLALYYKINGGTAQGVGNDFSGGSIVKFYGTTDPEVPADGTALPTCLSGALTPVAGTLNRTANPVSVTLAANRCYPAGAVVELSPDATPGNQICFEWRRYPEGTALNNVAASPVGCATVTEYQASR